MTEPTYPWIVCRNTPAGGHQFKCERCGATQRPMLPVPVSAFVQMITTFTESHKECPENSSISSDAK